MLWIQCFFAFSCCQYGGQNYFDFSMKMQHSGSASTAGARQGPPVSLYLPTLPLLSNFPNADNVFSVNLNHALDLVLDNFFSGHSSLRGIQPQSSMEHPAFLSLFIASSKMTNALSFPSFTSTDVGSGKREPARNKYHGFLFSQSSQHNTVEGKLDGQTMDCTH